MSSAFFVQTDLCCTLSPSLSAQPRFLSLLTEDEDDDVERVECVIGVIGVTRLPRDDTGDGMERDGWLLLFVALRHRGKPLVVLLPQLVYRE